jgi:hypothetical protein
MLQQHVYRHKTLDLEQMIETNGGDKRNINGEHFVEFTVFDHYHQEL